MLASASPRRRELLRQAGYEFRVQVAAIDETPLAGEAAEVYVDRLAQEKALAVAGLQDGKCVVLAADTTVVVDGEILGKPVDAADAQRMLELLSGREHWVMTGIAATQAGVGGRVVSAVERTRVCFAVIPAVELAEYVASGDPMDKAGAYAIQGYAARWIPRIEGDYTNVVGLPIARTVALLRELGV